MGLFGLEHPLGKDVASIYTALSDGVINLEGKPGQNPNIKLNYEKPDVSGVGVATLRIADWGTEDMTAIYYPVESDEADVTWQSLCEDGFEPVRQRIYTRDLLGRGFNLTINRKQVLTPYVQFDVLDDGVLLAVDDEGEQVVAFGRYESENYDLFDRMARHYSSVRAVLELTDVA